MNAQECYEMGEAYHAQGQYGKAQEYLQKAFQLAKMELPDVHPRKAVLYLAEKGYDFFEQEYNNLSNEIHSIIKTYSEFLATYHMAELHSSETTNEVIRNVLKPLNIYYDKLSAWIFNTLQSSNRKNFPNKFYYVRLAHSLYTDDQQGTDELLHSKYNEQSNLLMSGFVVDLYLSIKENYERVLRNNYPYEYHWLVNDKDGLSKMSSELYDRSMKFVLNCLKNLGVNISDKEIEKIIIQNQYVMGDKFEFNNAHSFTFVNKSNVVNSFNKVKEQFDEETANVIKKIAEIVEKSKNAEAVELFEAFNEEINKPEPKKSRLKSFWNSLSSVLPVLSSTVSIVEKIMKIIN